MTVGAKLQIKAGQSIAVFGLPEDVDLELPDVVEASGIPEVAIGFAPDAASIENLHVVIAAARTDLAAWIAYPKGGRLGTDLNREKLVALMEEYDLQPVRQISVNTVWSAVRFRPA